MEMLEDLAIDVPEAFKFMGIYFGVLVSAGVLSLADVQSLSASLLSSSALKPPGPKLLAEIFNHIKTEKGESALEQLWEKEKRGVDLVNFWPAAKRSPDAVAGWMDDNGFFFMDPLMKIVRGLKHRLTKEDSSTVIAWLEESVDDKAAKSPEFVRVLTNSIVQHLTSQTIFANGNKNPLEPTREMYNKWKDTISSVKPIFSKYLEQNVDEETSKLLQLEVLFSLQSYNAEIGYPKDLLENLFRIFYDEEIIDEPTFYDWKKDTKRELKSKKEAVKLLGGWFKWLEQSQTEEQA